MNPPSLCNLSIATINTGNQEQETTPMRLDETKLTEVLGDRLTDLPEELLANILTSMSVNDACNVYKSVCRLNSKSGSLCYQEEFWQQLLTNNGWLTSWSTGMPPKEQFAMLCSMSKQHRTTFLTLTDETQKHHSDWKCSVPSHFAICFKERGHWSFSSTHLLCLIHPSA